MSRLRPLCESCAKEYRCGGVCPCEYWPKREEREETNEEGEEE